MSATGDRPSVGEFDPFSPRILVDPYPHYRALRDDSPVHHVAAHGIYVVTRFEDVVAVVKNPTVFSSTGGVGPAFTQRPMMPMYDPPEHTRMRRMVAKHFTPAAAVLLKERVEKLADDLLDEAIDAGPVDLVDRIAIPLSLGTIAELFGVPRRHRKKLRRWSQGTVEELAGNLDEAAARRVNDLRREFNYFLRSLVEERRASGATEGSDVISRLIHAEEDEKLTPKELTAFCVLLLVAGFETTVNAIANGVLALLANPSECEKLQKNHDLVPSMVEEIVRFDGPVQSFFRNTLQETSLHGVTIPSGSKVMVVFASANRDPRKFADPDVFRVDRNPTDHVGYGAGIHTCLGAPLARLQLTALARAMVRRVRSMELAGEVVRSHNVLFRGVKALPVKLTGTAVPRATAAGKERNTIDAMTEDRMAAVVKFSVDKGVAVVTLSGPPTNAYDLATLKEIDAHLVEARFDKDIHVIVITGEGERFFCAGADTDMLREADPDYRYNFVLYTHEVLHRLEHSPKLTICAVNGNCFGGGLEIALSCDLRIARAGKFNVGFPEINVGVFPASGGTQRLPRLIGKGRAFELMVEGSLIGIDRAAEIGIFEKLWTEETGAAFSEKVMEYARSFTPPNKAPLAVGKLKRAVQSGLNSSLDEGLALERELAAQLFRSEDAEEGFAAFAARRKPEFRGR